MNELEKAIPYTGSHRHYQRSNMDLIRILYPITRKDIEIKYDLKYCEIKLLAFDNPDISFMKRESHKGMDIRFTKDIWNILATDPEYKYRRNRC